MQFVLGAAVLTPTGKHVGRVDRVVLKPETKVVTHIVVSNASVLGLDSGTAKVLPVDLIASAEAEHVSLKPDATSMDQFPDFQETLYVVVNEKEVKHGAPATSHSVPTIYGTPAYTPDSAIHSLGPAYVKENKENIPEGTVALKEGAKVLTAEGKHAGNVERVRTDSDGMATHFVISKGLLLKARKLIPADWVQEVEQDQMLLTVGAHSVDELADYDAEADAPGEVPGHRRD